MTRRDTTEEGLAALAALRQEDDPEVVRQQLTVALSQKRSGLLVARAAKLLVELGRGFDQGLDAASLLPTMEGAFRRLLVNPLKRDKGCFGKTELAKALVELEQPATETFLSGLRFVQLEPVWGGSVDAASSLRGWCAHGLVRSRHPEAMLRLAPLLVDGERPTRLAAAEALGDSGQMAAEALLRLKVTSGDDEPEVIGECCQSLLRLEPQRSWPFVAELLDHPEPSTVEAAALALGESRLEEVIEPLRRRLEATVDDDLQRSFYLALALTRRQQAIDLLEEEVDEGPIGRARWALVALAMHRHDEALHQRLSEHVKRRRDKELERIWREDFA